MPDIEFLKRIQEADMLLVGLGEEFDGTKDLRQSGEYGRGKAALESAHYDWLLPAWGEYCFRRLKSDSPRHELEKLKELLGDQNYFVISTATDSVISDIAWKGGRLVMPCGSGLKKQCSSGDCERVVALTEEDKERINVCFERIFKGEYERIEDFCPDLGVCGRCGAPMILNNIYAENYNENGYLEKWDLYMKWLQGTVNHKLLILELGVDLSFPSVIRWPFEKTVFFNRKAYLCRVHEKLYQLPEELASRGIGVSQNAIDWINHL